MALITRSLTLDNLGGAAKTAAQVLVRLRASNFADFASCRADGADIRITDSGGTALPFWLSYYNQTSQIADIYVKTDLAANATTTIKLLYGDNATPSLSSYANTMSKLPSFDSSYLAAYQLDEGSGSISADATGNGNTATLINSPAWQASDGGNYAGQSQSFSGSHILTNGSNQYISCANVLDTVPNNGTLAFWFKWVSVPSGSDKRILTKYNGGGASENLLDFYRSNPDSLYKLRFVIGGTSEFLTFSASILDNTNWNYIEIQWGSAGRKVHVNASQVAADAAKTGKWGDNSGGTPLTFGCYRDSGGTQQFVNAYFDGITIQNKQRTIGESQSAYRRLKYAKQYLKDIVSRSASNPIVSPSTELSSTATAVFEPKSVLTSDGNTVVMFYTAYEPSTNHHVICKAHTTSFPTGWTKDGTLIGRGVGGESGDACRGNIYVDGGTWYLFYADNAQSLVSNLRYITSTDEGTTWSSPTTLISTASLPSGAQGSTNTRLIKVGSTYHLFNELGYSSAPQWRLTRWTSSSVTGPYTYQGEITSLQPGSGTSTYSCGSLKYVNGLFHMVYHGTPGANNGGLPSYLWHAYTDDITADSWVQDGASNYVLSPLGTSPPEYDQVADAAFIELNNKAYIIYDGDDNVGTYEAWINVLESNPTTTLSQLFDGAGSVVSIGAASLIIIQTTSFANSNTFYGGVVTQGQTVTQSSRFDNANSFYGGVVTLTSGSQTVTQSSRFDNANGFYGGTVSLASGPQTVTQSSTFTNSNTFYGGVVTLLLQTVTQDSSFANTNNFYGGVVTGGETVATALPGLGGGGVYAKGTGRGYPFQYIPGYHDSKPKEKKRVKKIVEQAIEKLDPPQAVKERIEESKVIADVVAEQRAAQAKAAIDSLLEQIKAIELELEIEADDEDALMYLL